MQILYNSIMVENYMDCFMLPTAWISYQSINNKMPKVIIIIIIIIINILLYYYILIGMYKNSPVNFLQKCKGKEFIR